MHSPTSDLFYDVLDCLERVTTEQLLPDAALDRLRSVRDRHRHASIELVWDEEAFDGSVHYDALIRPPHARKTISVSVCPDDELPWALRGLQRWRDSELLRVNDVTMAVEQAITQLDVLWEQPGLMQRLIDSCIVTGELQRRDIQVSRAETQAAFDGIRRRRGLLSTAALRAWLENTGTSLSDLEELALRSARTTKLRNLLVSAEADAYLAAHRADFDDIKVAVLKLRTEVDAQRAMDMMRDGKTSLFEVAQHFFVVAGSRDVEIGFRQDARTTLRAEFDGWEMNIGATRLLARDDQFLIVQTLAVQPAQLSPATTERVKNVLFQEWLASQRRDARIEWFWGEAQRTLRAQTAQALVA